MSMNRRECIRNPESKPGELAKELGISIPTLYNYVSETRELVAIQQVWSKWMQVRMKAFRAALIYHSGRLVSHANRLVLKLPATGSGGLEQTVQTPGRILPVVEPTPDSRNQNEVPVNLGGAR